MMQRIEQLAKWLFIEPLKWLFLCFFQPSKFHKEVEISDVLLVPSIKRFKLLLRMSVFLLLVSYFITILIRLLFLSIVPDAYSHYLIGRGEALPTLSLFFYFFLDTLSAVTVATLLAPLIGMFFGMAFGIAFAISGAIWAGVTINSDITNTLYVSLTIGIFMLSGTIFGITIGSVRETRYPSGRATVIGVMGVLLALVLGIPVGILGGYLGGYVINVLLPTNSSRSTFASICGATSGVLVAIIVALVIIWIIRGSTRKIRFNMVFERALSLGTAFCLASAGIAGGTAGTLIGQESSRISMLPLFGQVTSSFIQPNWLAIILVAIGFVIGYFRLPLYPFSSVSILKAYRTSVTKPLSVFDLLHRSALYWDECVFLPLPGLRQMLLLGAKQNLEQALNEINFIVNERQTQIDEARAVALEIVLSELEAYENLEQVSLASRRIDELLPRDSGLLDSFHVTPFVRLNNASREATRFCTPLGLQARRDALNEMIIHLNQVQPSKVVDSRVFTRRLEGIVAKWLTMARDELTNLEQAVEIEGHIDNPYISGSALKANNSLFVGRRDLVQQLVRALNHGVNRPTFFLTGERRMGKTSTLNQLPVLLSARHIPIILDLQARGISASTSTFLGSIADVIYQEMDRRGIRLEKQLEAHYVREVCRENDALGYRVFDDWFRNVEATLKKHDYTLLLAFDEFEKLEEASNSRSLDINLLRDWFRNIIQNHERLALLFSGVRALDDMGAQWAGYFVNVKMLKVSLLHPSDASILITQPLPNYAGKDIFPDQVIEEIIRVTGCHPFLVQALCSEIIDLLNFEGRTEASLADVAIGAGRVLENWWPTYFRDLWERTKKDQRLCLAALHQLEQGNVVDIAQKGELSKRAAQTALELLKKRDLIVVDERGYYRIVAPMFATWVERNWVY